MTQLKQLQAFLIRHHLHQPPFSLNHLLLFCATSNLCNLTYATLLFSHIPNPNLFHYNTMVRGFSYREPEKSVLFYNDMLRNGILPDKFTFPFLLKASGFLALKEKGKEAHASAVKLGVSSDFYVQKGLVDFYAGIGEFQNVGKVIGEMPVLKCELGLNLGKNDDAGKVFDEMSQRDSSGLGCLVDGEIVPEEVFRFQRTIYVELRKRMVEHVISLLERCSRMRELKEIHAFVIRNGLYENGFVMSRVFVFCVNSDSGSLDHAHSLFETIEEPSLFLYNIMIRGYADKGFPIFAVDFYNRIFRKGLNLNCLWDDAISVFRLMETMGVKPNHSTIVNALTACVGSGDLDMGRSIHEKLDGDLVKHDVIIGTVLVDLYAKCGRIKFAHELFNDMFERNVVSWNVLVAGYSRVGRLEEAMRLFLKMENAGVKPNQMTMSILLSVCTQLKDVAIGKWIHYLVEKNKLELTLELGNALIEFHTRLGNLTVAKGVFKRMPERDLFSWNSIIAGYANSKYAREALNLFSEMKVLGVQPSKEILLNVLSACGSFGAIGVGREINNFIERHEIELDVLLGTALLNMYAMCGCIDDARRVFSKLPEKSNFSWTAMIIGLAMHGNSKEALDLFLEMQRTDLAPDEITFIGVLMSCNYSGLVDEGYRYLDYMKKECKIEPNVEHYRHMVELLGRLGLLEQALSVVIEMHVNPNGAIWRALLDGCRLHGNFA
ncbi:putative pentatricopeptide repeat-containing protein At3g05240 [Tasmannia lanceolata]|uniref:putative pentatricopeptide repeat-containing protein At3g05240 n=1 Tax=Tasmannia lanceolata TaxID=3420 RepID=UPI00406366D4